MKWTGMYLLGYVILIGGILAALWKMGILARIDTAWTLIGVVIAIGIGIMLAVTSSGNKETSKSIGSERCRRFDARDWRAELTRLIIKGVI